MVVAETSTQVVRLSGRLAKVQYQKKLDRFSRFLNQITMLEGKKGKGKTLAAVAILKNLKILFGLKVVVVGTRMGFTEEFGEYTYLDEKEFVAQLDLITQVSKQVSDDELQSVVDAALAKMGVDINNSILVFDEAYKLFDARTPSDKLVRIFGYFVAQSRHYNASIIIISPRRDMVDKRIRMQVDNWGKCKTTCRAVNGTCVRIRCPHKVTVDMIGGITQWSLNIYGPSYWNMYNSWSIPGYRQKHLDIKTY